MTQTILLISLLLALPAQVWAQETAPDYATTLREAQSGDAAAQHNLGVMYEHGQNVQQDPAKAVYWYRRAAEQGHSYAQTNLGMALDYGRGIKEDNVRAVGWYRKAAEQGNPKAQFNLARMYALGEGIERNLIVSYMWIELAAKQSENVSPNRTWLERRMSLNQIEKAKSLARQCEDRKYKNCSQ